MSHYTRCSGYRGSAETCDSLANNAGVALTTLGAGAHNVYFRCVFQMHFVIDAGWHGASNENRMGPEHRRGKLGGWTRKWKLSCFPLGRGLCSFGLACLLSSPVRLTWPPELTEKLDRPSRPHQPGMGMGPPVFSDAGARTTCFILTVSSNYPCS